MKIGCDQVKSQRCAAGRPTLIIPPALDPWYYGRTIHELGIGPEPLYMRKKLPSKGQIKQEHCMKEVIRAIEVYVLNA